MKETCIDVYGEIPSCYLTDMRYAKLLMKRCFES